MTVDLIIARYDEDLAWLDAAPASWRRIVYDKSQGGERQALTVGAWASRAGAGEAALYPEARPLPNVGCEAHTYATHVAWAYHDLADITVCLPGDAPAHRADILEVAAGAVEARVRYLGLGRRGSCDRDGGRTHPGLGPWLSLLWGAFRADPLPVRWRWHAWGMFVADRAALQRYPPMAWREAESLCRTKEAACAFERLWTPLLQEGA